MNNNCHQGINLRHNSKPYPHLHPQYCLFKTIGPMTSHCPYKDAHFAHFIPRGCKERGGRGLTDSGRGIRLSVVDFPAFSISQQNPALLTKTRKGLCVSMLVCLTLYIHVCFIKCAVSMFLGIVVQVKLTGEPSVMQVSREREKHY